MNPQNSNDETAAALREITQTPATLPLKRPTPIFAEAPLLPKTDAAPDTASLPPNNAAASPDNAAVPPDNVVTSSDDTAASLYSAVTIPDNIAASPDSAAGLQLDASVSPDETTGQEDNAAIPPDKAPLPQISFSPPPDEPFQSSLTLELRCDASSAEIRYALNAADVGADGTLYLASEKIFLPQSAGIAARAVVDGQLGPLATAQFQIVQPAWQKIEPLDQSDATPHEIGENCALEGSWKLAAASVRGKLHAHRGLWREDSLAYGLANSADATYSISIVSDGAGSANLSRVGSKLLCAVALEHLQNGLTQFAPLASDSQTLATRDLPVLRALLVEAASLALQRLREEAARRQKPLSDFSSTLLILVRREWQGAQLCAALQSGDGAIALWDEDEVMTLLGEADHGQHSSETKFLTTSGMEAELPARVKFSIRPRLLATLVMSDGIADDFFPETTRFPALINQVLPIVAADSAASESALLGWMRYEKKGSSDDRAMVICWRGDAAPAGIEAPAETAIAGETASKITATASDEATPPTLESIATPSAATPDAEIAMGSVASNAPTTSNASMPNPSISGAEKTEATLPAANSNVPQSQAETSHSGLEEGARPTLTLDLESGKGLHSLPIAESANVPIEAEADAAMPNLPASEAATPKAPPVGTAANPLAEPISSAAPPLISESQNPEARRDGEQ